MLWRQIFNKNIPFDAFTHYIHIFDSITKVKHTEERRHMINVSATLEAYNSLKISNIGRVSGIPNPAATVFKVTKDILIVTTVHDFAMDSP